MKDRGRVMHARSHPFGPPHLMSLYSHATAMFLWWAQPILQSVVAAVVWRRKIHRQFPIFFYFLVAQVVNFAITYPLYHNANYKWYFWCYWT
ncbi:MAG: hypothetical protein WA172_15645, partial [Terriglobales bacterium]